MCYAIVMACMNTKYFAKYHSSHFHFNNFSIPENKKLFDEIAAERRSDFEVFRRKVFRKKKIPTTSSSPKPNISKGFQNSGYTTIRKRKVIKKSNQNFPQPTTTKSPYPILNRTQDDPRFLSLFSIISFRNEPCMSGHGHNGTCYR